jgi:hypothetical protein
MKNTLAILGKGTCTERICPVVGVGASRVYEQTVRVQSPQLEFACSILLDLPFVYSLWLE